MRAIVQDLKLGRAVVDEIGTLDRAVEQAAVAARRDLPLERKLEVAKLFGGDDVARARYTRQRAVDRLPARRQRVLHVAAPTVHRAAVEQKAPSRCALLRGQRVLCGRRGLAGLLCCLPPARTHAPEQQANTENMDEQSIAHDEPPSP